ncbi:membrane protein [Rhodopirellula maiorica SM1]|uniref:Membrane protein n=1 Tax=Rhodopirellula maiorica SM1 TaxID=1265738 RepID=M5R7Z6_9BACT|nr:hypothetical protein [Rhodopirellula maiorica]EMI15510.1 membrane protein [Rhodopirellula maiorica SM1]
MAYSPDAPPSADASSHQTKQIDELCLELDKAIRSRFYALLCIPLVAFNSLVMYLRVWRPGQLPSWVGLVLFGMLITYVLLQQRKISRVRSRIHGDPELLMQWQASLDDHEADPAQYCSS